MIDEFTAPHRRAAVAASLALVAALSLAACTTDGTDPEGPDGPAVEPSLVFAGPNGEVPGLLDELQLTDDEIAEIQAGEYTAAFVWHRSETSSPPSSAAPAPSSKSSASRSSPRPRPRSTPAAQANNVQSVMALDPDIVVAIAADPTSAAASFQPILDAGAKLVIMTTPPAGYTAGNEFVSIVTENLTEAGRVNAQLLGEALGGQGKVAYLYYDADFWFTQQRDQAFKDWLAYLYPDIELVAEEGFADPAKAQDIAASVVARHPDLNGIYVCVGHRSCRGRARRSA